MKILHGADAHVGAPIPGYEDATGEALARFTQMATARDVDLAVWSGDTFHTRRPTPRQLRAVVRAAMGLRAAGIPLVIGTGNHDGYSTLGEPDSHVLGWWADLEMDGIEVMIERERRTVQTRDGSIVVAHLPYPHRRIAADVPIDQQMRVASERAAEAVEALGPADLLVAHVSIAGAMLGAETAMRIGWDTTIAEELLAPFGYAALGHIHRQQRIAPNAWYPGSAIQTGWGEDRTGWLLVDLADLSVEPIDGGGPRWVTIEVYEEEDWQVREVPVGSLVKAVLHPIERLGPGIAPKVVDAIEAMGAAYVKLEVVRAEAADHGGAARRVDLEQFDVASLMREWLEARQIPSEAPVQLGMEIVHSARNRSQA